MNTQKANIARMTLPPGRRILAVSDIHGNLPYFKGLLQKTGFCDDDILIIDGDFIEKGEYSLDTLHFVMELVRRGNVHAVCGNCDGWNSIFTMSEDALAESLAFLKSKKRGLIWDMCLKLGIDLMSAESLRPFKRVLAESFRAEFDFLAALPQAIETEHYIFVHAGIHGDKALNDHRPGELQKYDDFMNRGHKFSKWVIVGHWPVMLYGTDRVCANPVIDRASRIVSIDGGCVLKDDGQLNALVIPFDGSEDFSHIAYDSFPTARAMTYQPEGARSYYIRWGDNEVQVIKRGEEFSRCRHVRTGYEMDILTKYLYGEGELVRVNDCTDYVPEVFPGDEISIVETTSRGYFIKRGGYSGWYFGTVHSS